MSKLDFIFCEIEKTNFNIVYHQVIYMCDIFNLDDFFCCGLHEFSLKWFSLICSRKSLSLFVTNLLVKTDQV
jgi:hypothetical protein